MFTRHIHQPHLFPSLLLDSLLHAVWQVLVVTAVIVIRAHIAIRSGSAITLRILIFLFLIIPIIAALSCLFFIAIVSGILARLCINFLLLFDLVTLLFLHVFVQF